MILRYRFHYPGLVKDHRHSLPIRLDRSAGELPLWFSLRPPDVKVLVPVELLAR